jgi:hypothetical protein
MICRWISAAIVGLLLLAATAFSQQTAADRFRYERPIVTAGTGPQRLAIDVPLLAGAEPFLPPLPSGTTSERSASRLSDLRLFAENGTAVPYLLLYPPSGQPVWIRAHVLPLARTEKTSGFEADFGSAETLDAIRVAGLPSPFLKRLVLEGSGDREHWTLLAGEGTLFDLPDEGLRQTELAFAPGIFRYLRVTWNDTNTGRVPIPAAVDTRQVVGVVPPPALTAALTAERRPSEPGRSRYRIRLPAGRLPIVSLTLNVAGGHVFRQAAVYESRLSGGEATPAELGRTKLVRVVRDGIAAGDLRIPLAPPTEAEVDLVIDDGSNPPLEVTGATAVFAALPWIYFEAPAGSLVARYGNPSGRAPRYDLEAVRDSVNVASLPKATWAEAKRLNVPEASASPAPMPETGAPLDAAVFAYHRAIPDGPAGLMALGLDAAVLAHSRGPGRFADVRVVDAANRQIPYILERRDEPLTVDLTLNALAPQSPDLKSAAGHNRTTYGITLPYAKLPAATLVLETPARVFQRTVQAGIERPADRRRRDPWFEVVASADWSHRDQQTSAQPLALSVGALSSTDLLVTIDEGDNSPLPISAVRLLLPTYRLRFYRPAGATLMLVYGREDFSPPQYDLALLAPQVMGVEARETTAAPETASRTAGATFISTRTFWVFLSAAVLVLLALIVRLVRNSS